jgi:hypothetical protein
VSRPLGIVASALAVAAFVGVMGCGGSSRAEASTSEAQTSMVGTAGSAPAQPSASPPRYTLAATRRCLVASGFRVGPVGKPNPRLQALGDLAQRTSIAVRAGGQVVGLAFGDAKLLAELLAVPNDTYTLETKGNAVLLYAPSARVQASAVRRCLRS